MSQALPPISLEEFATIWNELEQTQTRLLITGGLALFLLQKERTHSGEKTTIKSTLWPINRYTTDADMIIPSEVVISAEYLEPVQAVLRRNGFEGAKGKLFWCFERTTPSGTMIVDLLCPESPGAKVNDFRVGPKNPALPSGSKIHGHLTPELLFLNLAPIGVPLVTGVALARIPHPVTLLVSKLIAAHDRVTNKALDPSNTPEQKLTHLEQGEKHAGDVLRILAMMTFAEFAVTRQELSASSNIYAINARIYAHQLQTLFPAVFSKWLPGEAKILADSLQQL